MTWLVMIFNLKMSRKKMTRTRKMGQVEIKSQLNRTLELPYPLQGHLWLSSKGTSDKIITTKLYILCTDGHINLNAILFIFLLIILRILFRQSYLLSNSFELRIVSSSLHLSRQFLVESFENILSKKFYNNWELEQILSFSLSVNNFDLVDSLLSKINGEIEYVSQVYFSITVCCRQPSSIDSTRESYRLLCTLAGDLFKVFSKNMIFLIKPIPRFSPLCLIV